MKKIFPVLLFSFFHVVFTTNAGAQGNYPVTMQVQLAPPYSAYISDYKYKPVISFTNHAQTPLDIYIRGRLENDRGQYIQTAPNVFSNIPIHVPGMQTVVVQGSQLDENYLNLNNLQTNLDDESYSNLFRLGLMPEGFYTFCIYAYARDANGNYFPVSDPQGPGSCFAYDVGYVVPPKILSPLPDDRVLSSPNQNINISWTRPMGNVQGAALVYDLYMVKVLPDEDPNVSLNNAVQYGAGLFMKRSDIPINNFQFTNLTTFRLDEGSQYAIMVQARDLTGKTAFENNGRSETEVFQYGFGNATVISGKISLVKQGACSCAVDLASLDKTNNNTSLKAGGSFTMASLPVKIGTLSNQGTTVSGEGTILMNSVPVQITFTGIIVNKSGIAVAGAASAKTANGFGFLNNGGMPSVSTADYNSFMDRIRNYNLDAIKNGAGIMLPFGLKAVGAPDEVNAGIVKLNITPAQATYSAIAVVQLADANNVLSLLAKDVCFSNASSMCGDALFMLDEDFDVPGIHLRFKSYQSDADPGTYVLYSKNELKKFHIRAEYDFPPSLITKADGTPEKAVLDADAGSWSNWTAFVEMEAFKLPAVDDMVFTLKTDAFYDHSTLQNPDGMPAALNDAALAEKDPVIGNVLWTGFFIPSVSVALPSIVKNTRRPDDKLEIAATNLILDKDGLTGVVSAKHIVSIGDGSLGGWYCSVDDINIKLMNSSYKAGGMLGKVILPFSDKDNVQSQIDYSCILSSVNNGGSLQYQFVAKQKNDIDFSAWRAHINLNNCSIQATNNTATRNTVASADLSGKLSLEGNIQGFKIDLDLVEVEHLIVQTQQPYVRVQHAVMGFSSPQHFMAGFPISVTNIHPVVTGTKAGLQFDFGLTVSDINNKLLPDASSTFTVSANVLGGERPVWQPTDIEVAKVCIKGNLAGVVHIKEACIDFFHDDPVFGDGIGGSVDASFAGLDAVEVNCNAKFGNKSFNYWYFDASVTFPPVPVAPGISINGFGGGAWYNLARTAGNNDISARDYFKNMSRYQVGAYKPQSGSLGFKAKIGICTNDGLIFSGYGEIGMDFNTNGAFSVSSIDGTVYAEMLKTAKGIADDAKAPVQGIVNWHIGIADKVYDINGAMELKEPFMGAPLVQGNGWFDLLADAANNNYYIKLGEPQQDKRIQLSVADLFNFKAYFMAGNNINASIPDPDPDIVDVSKLNGYEKLNYDPSAGGMVLGASLKFDKELDYLIFYLKASAGIGFDISLAHYETGCGDNPVPPGLNGWYGLGQVYAGFSGEMGLYVDLFFFTGRVKALDVYASLLLRGGMPNPYWFDGYAQFGYDVFDGAVSGNVNFHISVGDKCVPEKQNFTMPLIQELKPADQAADVPLNASPEVIFNYPAEKQFDLVVQNGDGREQTRSFRLQIENCTVTNLANNRIYANYYDGSSYPVFADKPHKDLLMTPDDALEPQTRYRFNVSVKAQELTGDVWEDSYYKGEVVTGNESAAFKTGDCKLDEYIANPNNRLGAFPFPNQRYFLQGESSQGAIILDRNYSCADHPDQKYDLLVRLTPVKNHQELASIEKPVIFNSSRYLKFDISSLPKECIVRVEVIKREKMTAEENFRMFNNNLPLLTSLNKSLSGHPGGKLTTIANKETGYFNGQMISADELTEDQEYKKNVRFTSFNTDHTLNLTNKTVDIVLYSYHFRTSRYNTLKEKMDGMYYDATIGYSTLGSPAIQLKAGEKFDSYDANGFVSSKYAGGTLVYYSVPVVTFKENNNYNNWLRNQAIPCVYQSFTNAGLSLLTERIGSGLSYQEVQHTGIACQDGAPYCAPLRPIDIAGCDPPLTKQEIEADEVSGFFGNTTILKDSQYLQAARTNANYFIH